MESQEICRKSSRPELPQHRREWPSVITRVVHELEHRALGGYCQVSPEGSDGQQRIIVSGGEFEPMAVLQFLMNGGAPQELRQQAFAPGTDGSGRQ